MPTPTRRVDLLEEKMEALSDVPDRVTRLEDEVRSGFGRVWAELEAVRGDLGRVRDEIRTGDEETRNRMLILHEDVIARFALLQEGIDRVNGRAKRRRSPQNDK